MDSLLLSALLIFLLNAGGYLYGFLRQTDKLTDLLYSLSFALAAVFVFLYADPGHRAAASMTLMVVIWAIRLGGYLFVRIHRMDKDERFDEMRPNALRLAGFWLLQALTVWVVLLPLNLALRYPEPALSMIPSQALIEGLGSAVWLVGLAIESAADWQKFQFRNNPANKGRFVSTGLWKWLRHPNYLGEILVWLGFFLFSLPHTMPLIWAAAISPLWIAFLLIKVSGIPLLERAAEKRYGHLPAFQEYKRKSYRLLPGIW
jgi:steroid 5-alpha reductase family enzyme